MAVTVDTLKLTQVQGVVAVREDGSTPAAGTIALATTLKKSRPLWRRKVRAP